MFQPRIALIRLPGSPLQAMLDQTLQGAEVLALDPAAPELPAEALCGGHLVLWDLAGFDQGQRRAWAEVLAPDQVGLVLATFRLDQEAEALALECGALGLIGPSHDPALSRAVLAMAADWQGRYCRLLAELARARQQLADREDIERAKSILIAALGLSEPEAMSKLQQQARRTNQKLVQVARKVIATNRVFNGEE